MLLDFSCFELQKYKLLEKVFYIRPFKGEILSKLCFHSGLREKDIMCCKPVFFPAYIYLWCLRKVMFLLGTFVMKIIPHAKIFN